MIINKYIDYSYYKKKYNDLVSFNNNKLFVHFFRHGFYEDRICSLKYEKDFMFDYEFYINKYKDLVSFNTLESAFNHYINKGYYEKRNIRYFNIYNDLNNTKVLKETNNEDNNEIKYFIINKVYNIYKKRHYLSI